MKPALLPLITSTGLTVITGTLIASCAWAPAQPGSLSPAAALGGAGQPMTAMAARPGEVQLGAQLFGDARLSRDGRVSCTSCHDPRLGYSNGKPVGVGIDGALGRRNVPTVLGAVHSPYQFWDGRARTLAEQALVPLQAPDEMAMPLPELVGRLEAIPAYATSFRSVYGGPATPERVGQAIAAYEATLIAPPDNMARLLRGDPAALAALSAQQRTGWSQFRILGCISCHAGVELRDGDFHNLGVGMDKPNPDLGRYAVTGDARDRGAFKTPPLRNVADTAPYMHDGSLATLADVVDFYDKGGVPNQQLDRKIKPLHLAPWQKNALVAFLSTLQYRPAGTTVSTRRHPSP